MSRPSIDRRTFLGYAGMSAIPALARGVSGGLLIPGLAPGVSPAAPPELEDATIAELQAGMASGKYTSRSITVVVLPRIEAMAKQAPGCRPGPEAEPDP